MWKIVAILLAVFFPISAVSQEPKVSVTPKESLPDAAVIEAVLVDFLTTKESPVERRGGKDEKVIWVAEASFDSTPFLENFLNAKDQEGKPIAKEKIEALRAPAENLILRAKNKDLLQPFKPSDQRIRVYSKMQEEADKGKLSFERPQVFEFHAPGYSKDKRFAAVHCRFPWSAYHVAFGHLLLEKREGKWLVVVRSFSYLL
jgi:hypothetical protein